jgi:RHS repeat-associated protein
MARIPESELERLKNEVSVQRLVESAAIALKKSGKDFIGCCPFHADDTASLVVTPEKNLWHCFGCGAAGGPIDWMMRHNGVSFRHAVELLREGISSLAAEPLKSSRVRKLPAPVSLDADDQKLLNQVVDFYHQCLKQSPQALAYLEARGLTGSAAAEAIDTFKLGFADRTLGLRLPDKRWKAGADIRARLESIGIYRESGHEVVNGYQNNSGAMTNYTYHHDALESVLGQSGNTGTVVAAQGYTSFGSIVNATGSSNNTLKFTGREQDVETGLYYYRARYYDSLTGRFLSEDPIRSGINWYTYCNNNPVNCRDPSGFDGIGVNAGGTIEGGIGYGAAYQANSGIAFFWGGANSSIGTYTASGGFLGGYIAFPPPGSGEPQSTNGSFNPAQMVIGLTAGLGDGVFYTNANKAEDLLGPFDTWTLNLPIVSLQFAYDGTTYVGSASIGKSWGFSLSRYSVNTTTAKTIKSFNQPTTSSGKTVGPQSNATALSNAANSALVAGTNSAMDAVNSAINPPSAPAPTGTLTTELLGFGEDGAADGGFILYPNMSNTNQIQSVYSKH